jgi:hypothetical protein
MPISPAAVSSSAMHGAVVPIAYAVANGTSSTISFTNIPQNYQDLMIVGFARSDNSTSTGFSYYLNSAGLGNFSQTLLIGNGSSASSARYTTSNCYGVVSPLLPFSTSTSGVFSSTELHILNYTNSTTYKTSILRNACDLNGSGETDLIVNTYLSTSPITLMNIATNGNFVSGTKFALYGIRTVGQ